MEFLPESRTIAQEEIPARGAAPADPLDVADCSSAIVAHGAHGFFLFFLLPQIPMCLPDVADHHGAFILLFRQVNFPSGEIRAVTLPFALSSVDQIDGALSPSSRGVLIRFIASGVGCPKPFFPVEMTTQRGRVTSRSSSDGAFL